MVTPNSPLETPSMTLPEALQRANAHWQAGQAAPAQQLCQRILAAVPGQPDALHLLGLIAHAYGDTEQAIVMLAQATAHPQAAPVYFSNLAELYRLRGRLPEGEAAARAALDRAPELAGAWNNLGILLQEMGRYDESRECLERVRCLEPNNPQVLNNLGNTCLRQGDLTQAEQYWREAITQDPGYAQPYSNLAKMLTDRGDPEAARAAGRQAIVLNPHLADAYINLAAVELEAGQTAEALHWLHALLAFAPQHAGGLATRAILYVEQENLLAAAADAEAAVALAPQSADAHYALGRVRQAQGSTDAALSAFVRAAELPGTKTEDAVIAAAVLHMEEGHKETADHTFAQLIERFPQSASAWYNWADLHQFGPEDPRIAQMEALLASPQRLPRDQMRLHFALGKAFLDVGDGDRAFAHFHAGNAQKRASFAYDADQVSVWTDAIMGVLTPERYQALTGQGQGQDEKDPGQPIFVLGLPRSGTTLVERVLAAHSHVQAGGELSALQQVMSEQNYPEVLTQITPGKLQEWGAAYLAKTAPLAGGHHYLIDKMPGNFFYAGLIPLILPQAKVIWCRRDLVDTGLSCYTKLFSGEQRFSYRLDEIGRFAQDASRLLTHWQALLPPDRFLIVDYEALVADFEPQVRRLLTFLGLDWETAINDFHRRPGRVRTASVNQVREPLHGRAVGRWRPYAAHLQPLLTTLGVDPEAAPSPAPDHLPVAAPTSAGRRRATTP